MKDKWDIYDLAEAAALMKEWYSVKEVAEMFSVHTSTIYSWVGKGVIGSMKLGTGAGSVRIPKSEIQRLIGENYREAVSR